jgi:hypothetical protein
VSLTPFSVLRVGVASQAQAWNSPRRAFQKWNEMKNLKLHFLLPIALLHAYAFVYAWSFVGSKVLFAMGDAGPFAFATVFASLASAAISSTPLAWLAGRLAPRMPAWVAALAFVLGYVALVAYSVGMSALLSESRRWSLPGEIVAIAVFAAAGLVLGSRGRRALPATAS